MSDIYAISVRYVSVLMLLSVALYTFILAVAGFASETNWFLHHYTSAKADSGSVRDQTSIRKTGPSCSLGFDV